MLLQPSVLIGGFLTLLLLGLLPIALPLLRRRAWVAFAVVAILFVGITMGLYRHWGSGDEIFSQLVALQRHQDLTQQFASLGTTDEIIAKLKQGISQQPTNPEGWYLLGRVYFSTQQIPEAIRALGEANELKPHDPRIMVAYAMALFLSENSVAETKAKNLINEVLTAEPDHEQARALQQLLKPAAPA